MGKKTNPDADQLCGEKWKSRLYKLSKNEDNLRDVTEKKTK